MVVLVAGVAGALTAMVLTPVVVNWAVNRKIVDRPDARKRHRAPVALLGGVSVIVSVMIGGSTAFWLAGEDVVMNRSAVSELGLLLGSAGGVLILLLVGVWDDINPVPISVKLAAQFMSAATLMVFFRPLTWMPARGAAVVAAVFWLMLITNSFNLIDNMDGSAPGLGAIAAVFLTVLAGPGMVGVVGAALAGGLAGFLFFNRPPARVFLGDGGSLPIGFLLGAVGLWAAGRSDRFALAVLMVLAVPLLDTCLVMVSRLRRRLNPLTTPGTDHLSHRLVALGLPIPAALALMWALGIGFGFVGCAAAPPSSIEGWIVVAGAALFGFGVIIAMERFAPVGLSGTGGGGSARTGLGG